MLAKKKDERPIITDLLDYFKEQKIPYALKMGLTELDKNNMNEYKSGKVKAFDKKRQIEKNTIGISKDFNALKNRIIASNEKFKKFQFKADPSVHDPTSMGSNSQKKRITRYPDVTLSKADINFASQAQQQ